VLTIVCSGPQSQHRKALKALRDAGFTVVLDDTGEPSAHDWGQSIEGRVPQAFLTVEGDDVNRLVSALETAKWRLRAHWDKPE
jgi:hypothetical protein